MSTVPKTGPAGSSAPGQPSPLVDEYIAAQTPEARPPLVAVRAAIRSAAPAARERVAWSMPTFWQGQNLVHFAAHARHIGLYPGGEAVAVFADRLAGLKTSKGAIQFPLDQPIDLGLIGDIVAWRVAQAAQ
ncbi:MAG: DUF1801 domain-containing protein [Propionibacteriaceae bacterium]|nr:DUF1801 domain-containing protein [Propionibacteriaceae bacterium]